MPVITVIAKNPKAFAMQAFLNGVELDYLGDNAFDAVGSQVKIETLAAQTDSVIVNNLDIKCLP